MLSDELKKRLSQLNRGELKNIPDSIEQKPPGPVEKPDFVIPKREKIPLEKVIQGEIKKIRNDGFLIIEQTLPNFYDDTDNIVEEFVHQMDRSKMMGINNELSEDMLKLSHTKPESLIFLDIETCGLSAAPLFLIGLMFLKEKNFVFNQLFARDYSEEKELLVYLNHFVTEYPLLVTFNGKSFDIPFIIDRSIANRVKFNYNPDHIDLLHESRRKWKMHLPNCKLQTIEKYICRRRRTGDIPGSEIPQVYHDYVKTGNAFRVGDILYHNLVDLLTMAEIITHILKQIR